MGERFKDCQVSEFLTREKQIIKLGQKMKWTVERFESLYRTTEVTNPYEVRDKKTGEAL